MYVVEPTNCLLLFLLPDHTSLVLGRGRSQNLDMRAGKERGANVHKCYGTRDRFDEKSSKYILKLQKSVTYVLT